MDHPSFPVRSIPELAADLGVELAPTKAPRVTVYCPESLRALACCVVDGLTVRGYAADVRSGAEARAALREPMAPGDDWLRVLWLRDTGDPEARRRIRRGLDPQGRQDLLILTLATPQDVIRAVESAARGPEASRRPRRPTRAFMQPTLVESKVELSRFGMPGLVAAGVVAVILGSALALQPQPRPAGIDSRAVAVAQPAAAVPEQPVLSSIRLDQLDVPADAESEATEVIVRGSASRATEEHPAPASREIRPAGASVSLAATASTASRPEAARPDADLRLQPAADNRAEAPRPNADLRSQTAATPSLASGAENTPANQEAEDAAVEQSAGREASAEREASGADEGLLTPSVRATPGLTRPGAPALLDPFGPSPVARPRAQR